LSESTKQLSRLLAWLAVVLPWVLRSSEKTTAEIYGAAHVKPPVGFLAFGLDSKY
jgi:hypothetical protein